VPVVWRDDLAAAVDLARAEGRPLLVVLRCPPCKQCSAFDEDVLSGGPALDPLLARFVTVRVTDMSRVDLRVFPVEGFQDLDLSWWAWILAPDLRVIAVFGGRDEVSDTTRISVPALAATLRRVLDDPDAHRIAEGAPERPALPPLRAADLPGFAAWSASPDREASSCLHCHQVAEILRQPALDAGAFDPRQDLAIWPLPENVGLALDRDHGLRVREVVAGSPAARAGIRAGDELVVAGGRRLYGQTDLRGVLHRGPPAAGCIPVEWAREGVRGRGELAVEPGWRATVLDWRMSVSQGNVGAGPGFFPNPVPAGRRKELGIEPGRLAVAPWFGPHPSSAAWRAGLRAGDAILAVDGIDEERAGRGFLVWFRTRYEPGDEVRFTVTRAPGERREVRVRLDG